MATIVLTGGGSAGHCTPHLAILPYLKNDFDKIYYIGSNDGIEKDIISKTDIPYYAVPCAKFSRKFNAKNLTMPFKVISGIMEAGKILDKIKPNVIFSKGGYVSIPTVLAAKQRKIPIISHESDFTLGLANKFSSRLSEKVLTSFPDTAKKLKNGEFVGSPIRKSIFSVDKKKALSYFNLSGNKPILLVTGGSSGAKTLNSVLREALNDLTLKYDIIHICGKGNLIQDKVPKGYIQKEYLDNIENAFAIASIAVTRAGSNTLFELMALKIPCVLIPLPKGVSRGDQVLNAEYFEKIGLADVLEQKSLTKESLIFHINSVYANRFNLIKNFEKYPIKDSSRQISRIIADYVH